MFNELEVIIEIIWFVNVYNATRWYIYTYTNKFL